MDTFPLTDARDQLGDIVAMVRRTQEPVTITRYGRAEVVILDVEEYRQLEALRDAADVAYIRDRMREAEPTVPLVQVMRDLGRQDEMSA